MKYGLSFLLLSYHLAYGHGLVGSNFYANNLVYFDMEHHLIYVTSFQSVTQSKTRASDFDGDN
jgi:hypothetical protein